MTSEFERLVLLDWQAGRLRWPDAVASLGLAGLPALYILAYRIGVRVERRFADEARLPDLAKRFDLTPEAWRANPAWQPFWHDGFEEDVRRTPGYGSGPGHAQRRSEGLERGFWWLVREQHSVEFGRWEFDRMSREAAEERGRWRRIRHRVTWLELTFDPLPDDPCRAVVELWSNAETSTKMACEILDVDLAGLLRLAAELGVPFRPDVTATVAPAGLPDTVIDRIQRIADAYPEDDADRHRLARQIIRKRLDRTVPHPELTPSDFVEAWLDGDVRIDELPERMGVPPAQVDRMRSEALAAAIAAMDGT